MTVEQDQNLLRLAGRLGDRSVIEQALHAGLETEEILRLLMDIKPPRLSIERFVKFFVRDAFKANCVKLVSDLIELSENISSAKDLKKAMADYIQVKRAEYEAQGREKALDWFHNVTIRRRRKHVSLSNHLEY